MQSLNSVGMEARKRPDGQWDALVKIGDNPSLGIVAHVLRVGGPWKTEEQALQEATRLCGHGLFEPESAGSALFEYQRTQGQRLNYTVVLNSATYVVKLGDKILMSGQRFAIESGLKPWQADLVWVFNEIESLEHMQEL